MANETVRKALSGIQVSFATRCMGKYVFVWCTLYGWMAELDLCGYESDSSVWIKQNKKDEKESWSNVSLPVPLHVKPFTHRWLDFVFHLFRVSRYFYLNCCSNISFSFFFCLRWIPITFVLVRSQSMQTTYNFCIEHRRIISIRHLLKRRKDTDRSIGWQANNISLTILVANKKIRETSTTTQ